MRVLIFYATIEGQTGKIAEFIATALRKAGHEALLHTADDPRPLPLDQSDAVILAAPVHERRHPRAFEDSLNMQADTLSKLPTLMLSVSLSAAFPERLDEARDYLVEMKMRTEFEPSAEALVAGAVRASSYDYYEAQIVDRVVLRDQSPVSPGRDAEFTDWDALATTVSSFLSNVSAERIG